MEFLYSQETRIGLLVNTVRRKTTNKSLARRAKELVKSWKNLVEVRQPASVPTLNRSTSAASINRLTSPNNSVDSSLSRSQIPSTPNTPSLPNVNNKISSHHAAKRSNSSPLWSGVSAAKRPCISPSIYSQPSTPDSVCSYSSLGSVTNNGRSNKALPQHSRGTSNTQDSSDLQRTRSEFNIAKDKHGPDIRATQSTSNLAAKLKSGQNGIVVPTTPHVNGTEISTPTHSIETKGLKTTIRFNKSSPPMPSPLVNGYTETPKKRGRGRPPKNKPLEHPTPHNGSSASVKSFAEKRKAKLDIKTDLESPGYVSLTPKVKSTAELMEELQAKNSLTVGKDTARQIRTNLIPKELDEEIHSIVPDGAKPRQHRKKFAPPSTPVSMQQTKNEMVEKFLESSVTHSEPEDLSPLKYEMPRTESPGNASTSFDDKESIESAHNGHRVKSDVGVKTSVNGTATVISKNSILKTEHKAENATSSEKPLTLDEIYSKYPPLDLDNFEFIDSSYELPDLPDVGDAEVERLHTDHWDSVNGNYNTWGEWRDWSQTISRPSYQGDQLHILPYVVIDD